MLVKTAILSGLAATAAAEMAAYPAHAAARRSLEARQTVDFGNVPGLTEATACASAFLELYTTLPTPPPALIEELTKQTGVPDVCNCMFFSPSLFLSLKDVFSWNKYPPPSTG